MEPDYFGNGPNDMHITHCPNCQISLAIKCWFLRWETALYSRSERWQIADYEGHRYSARAIGAGSAKRYQASINGISLAICGTMEQAKEACENNIKEVLRIINDSRK